jgi:hypothetical protein
LYEEFARQINTLQVKNAFNPFTMSKLKKQISRSGKMNTNQLKYLINTFVTKAGPTTTASSARP